MHASTLAPFSFRTIPNLVCEPGATAHLPALVAHHFPLVCRLLIVSSPDIGQCALLAPAVRALKDAGMSVEMFSEVRSRPTEAVILRATAEARRREIEIVVGWGDGSAMDVAKLVASLALNEQDLATAYGVNKLSGPRLPLIQIPTTAGSSAEAMPFVAVAMDEAADKTIVSPALYADLVILDARLTSNHFPKATAADGIGAMARAIEAYAAPQKKNPLSDMLASQALRFLSAHILTACRDNTNLVAKQAMQLGGLLAGQSFANAPSPTMQALAAPVTGIFQVPESLARALVLAHVLRFNASSARAQYAELAEIVAPGASGSEEARVEALIARLAGIALETGIETRLREVGVGESDLDRLADAALLQMLELQYGPSLLTRADARAIYAAAL